MKILKLFIIWLVLSKNIFAQPTGGGSGGFDNISEMELVAATHNFDLIDAVEIGATFPELTVAPVLKIEKTTFGKISKELNSKFAEVTIGNASSKFTKYSSTANAIVLQNEEGIRVGLNKAVDPEDVTLGKIDYVAKSVVITVK